MGQDAAVIFALDPVYGAFFAYLLQGEQLGRSGYVGVVLVLAAVLISYYSADTCADDALADVAPEEYDTVRGEYEKVPTLSPATLTEANGEEMLPLDETAKPTAAAMNERDKGE